MKNKTKRIFEGAVLIIIALAFVMPSSIVFANEEEKSGNRDFTWARVYGFNKDNVQKEQVQVIIEPGWFDPMDIYYIGSVPANTYFESDIIGMNFVYHRVTLRWYEHGWQSIIWNNVFPTHEHGIFLIGPMNIPHIGGPTCFLADTPINMADGSVKNIQNVNVGDEVISFDESTKKLASAKVSEVFHHVGDDMSESYLIINDNIRITSNHPLYINGKWEQAGNAEIGDNLLGINGMPVAIQSIETVNEKVQTYNLEVDIYHNYFAEGILAHNKPPNFACLFIEEGP